jgi:hypothetical protein
VAVNPIGGGLSWQAAQQSSPSQRNWQNVLTAASSALGMSTRAVQRQLQGGASLSSIANSRGVPQETLVEAITTALSHEQGQADGGPRYQFDELA